MRLRVGSNADRERGCGGQIRIVLDVQSVTDEGLAGGLSGPMRGSEVVANQPSLSWRGLGRKMRGIVLL